MPGKCRARGKIAEAILAARPAGVVRPYLMLPHQVGPFFYVSILYHDRINLFSMGVSDFRFNT